MQRKKGTRSINILEASEFSWPVKIRANATSLSVAARKSPIFPASDPLNKIKMYLPPLKVLAPKSSRGMLGAFDRWLMKLRKGGRC